MKKQPEVTPWFPADVKPVRTGFYQREYKFQVDVQSPDKWDGRQWIVCGDRGQAIQVAGQKLRWRGLASDPKVSA